MVNLDRMVAQLDMHEGFRPKPYRDTVGKLTVGHGYNLDDRGLASLSAALGRGVTLAYLNETGLTRDESLKVLRADIKHFEQKVRQRWPLYDKLDEVRQRCVLDFVFNVGGTKAQKFVSAIGALTLAVQHHDPRIVQVCWDACCYHMMDSLWARQVDDGLGGRYGRADRLCDMLRTGKDWTA